MSHVTRIAHMNGSCHTYFHTKDSCHTYIWWPHVDESCHSITLNDESCHTCCAHESDMSRVLHIRMSPVTLIIIWRSHVTQISDDHTWMSLVTYEWVVSHILQCVACVLMTTYEWVMLHLLHLWVSMSHVLPYEWVMSHTLQCIGCVLITRISMPSYVWHDSFIRGDEIYVAIRYMCDVTHSCIYTYYSALGVFWWPNMNESRHTDIWWPHMNESCHIWMSPVTHITVRCMCSDGHIWMSHLTWMSHVTYEWVMSHILQCVGCVLMTRTSMPRLMDFLCKGGVQRGGMMCLCVYTYVLMYVHMCVCACMYIYIYLYVSVCVCRWIYIYICVYMYIQICIRIHGHVSMCVRVCVRVCVYSYINMCISVCS